MKHLSTGDDLRLGLVGSAPPDTLAECTSYSSIHKRLRLDGLPRDGVDCYWVDSKPYLDALPDDLDFVMNINPGARKEMLEDPAAFRRVARPVVFQTLRVNVPPEGVITLALVPRGTAEPAPDGWGDGPTRVGDGEYLLYPYAPRPEVRDRTEPGTILIDNQRDKNWPGNDTALFWDVLGELRESYDLEVWQEHTVHPDTPDWVRDASAGHVKTYDDGGPPRAVRPWTEFKEVVNRAMLFLPARPGSYGADKFNCIASGGQVCIREGFEKRSVVEAFGVREFRDRATLRAQVVDALHQYDRDPGGYSRFADDVWSAERWCDEVIGLLKGLKE